jgi:hypothetical protein
MYVAYGEPFPWRMDDPCVAYAIFEKALEPGVTTIGVPIEHTQAREDMDGAAATFPDINFVIFHVGLSFIDKICWQLVRYPNLDVPITATLNVVVRAPRAFAENMGKLLFCCGEGETLYEAKRLSGTRAGPWMPSGTSRSPKIWPPGTATRI